MHRADYLSLLEVECKVILGENLGCPLSAKMRGKFALFCLTPIKCTLNANDEQIDVKYKGYTGNLKHNRKMKLSRCNIASAFSF